MVPMRIVFPAVLAVSVLGTGLYVPAQGGSVLPAGYEKLPGNGAFSLPLRWHEGLMQVLLRSDKPGGVVPQVMLGKSLKSMSVRRPSFFGEPAYGGLTRTFTVRLASTQIQISSLARDMGANRTTVEAATGATKLTAVVTAKQFNIPATAAAAYTDAVGKDLVTVPFATPYPFKGPDLFIDWETTSSNKVPDKNVWVDSLVFTFGGDFGVVLTLGQGGCSSVKPRSGLPMSLQGNGATPAANSTITLQLTNALPDAESVLFYGPNLFLKSTGIRPYPTYRPARRGCHVWTDPFLYGTGRTDSQGRLDYKVTIPALTQKLFGKVFVFQALVEDRKGGYQELSNGVAVLPGSSRVRDWGSTVLCPWTYELNSQNQKIPPTSPWNPFPHSLPVFRFTW